MLDKLKLVEEKYMEMEERSAQPDFYSDPKAAAKLLKEQKDLEPVVEAYRAYRKTQQELHDLRELLDGSLAGGGNVSGEVALSSTTATNSVTTSGDFTAGTTLADGNTFSYTVSWQDAGGQGHSVTVNFTADVTNNQLVAEDGTTYSLATGATPTATELQTAVMGELNKNSNLTNAFRTVVNDAENPRDTLMWYNKDINAEITRKLEDLGMYS